MMYSVPKPVRDANGPVFLYEIGGRLVFVKEKRRERKTLSRLVQRLLYAVTGNILVMPPARPDGNPVDFETDMLRRLAGLGIRVPEVLHREDDYFVMSHVGQTLEQFLLGHPGQRLRLLDQAAAELRRLHDLGFAHGGAQIKNITVQDGEIYFIDFETGIPPGRLAKFQLRDLFLFLLSLERHLLDPDVQRICAVYDGRENGPSLTAICTCLRGFRVVRLFEHPWLRGLSMRDIRGLSALVRKAEAIADRLAETEKREKHVHNA